MIDIVQSVIIPCTPCIGAECDYLPKDCKYGEYRNSCGRMDCYKGPGEECGGWLDVFGVCTPSTSCKCGRCSGCSTHSQVQCWMNTDPMCN
ncbi:hypothetical protein O3M35_009221 [Rhynocoris fuscipes]|uniref:Neuroparsin-A n=1 Tax=Rhynocoris fuscipes TaxID=488301 RepID=A0AAW1D540_9HEMI